jgi:hypothetical protein
MQLGAEHFLVQVSGQYWPDPRMHSSQCRVVQEKAHWLLGASLHSSQLPVQLVLSLHFWISVAKQESHLSAILSHGLLQAERTEAWHDVLHCE